MFDPLLEFLRKWVAAHPQETLAILYGFPALVCLFLLAYLVSNSDDKDIYNPAVGYGVIFACLVWPVTLVAATLYLVGRALWRLGTPKPEAKP